MAQDRVQLTCIGRMVMGNLYVPNDKDFDGKPLTIKTGPNAGQARVSYFIGLAIAKGAERGWWETAWGSAIYSVGSRAFPSACQRADFAWKIEDGDSQQPNKRNRRPCDNEGWPGHWILKLSGGFAPKVFELVDGPQGRGYVQHLEPDYIKPGYYVEVAFNVDDNGQQNNPGVYLNHNMICFRGFGKEIVFGPRVEEAGFGQAPLPAGASAVPLASGLPLPAMPPVGASALPAAAYPSPAALPAPAPAPGTPGVVYGQPAYPSTPVYPQPGFVQMPPPAPAPGAVQAAPAVAPQYPQAAMLPASPGAMPVASPSNLPPAGPRYRMTAKAGNVSREAYLQANWTDAQLLQNGLMEIY